jgi:hypothetical protein
MKCVDAIHAVIWPVPASFITVIIYKMEYKVCSYLPLRSFCSFSVATAGTDLFLHLFHIRIQLWSFNAHYQFSLKYSNKQWHINGIQIYWSVILKQCFCDLHIVSLFGKSGDLKQTLKCSRDVKNYSTWHY